MNKKDIEYLSSRIENLVKENEILKRELKSQENVHRATAEKLELDRIKLLSKVNNLGLNKKDFIYVEYFKDDKSPVFCNLGFVVKETINHLKIVVYDKKRNSAHKYSINKNCIRGIKHYDGSFESIISYEDLMKLWRQNKNKK